MSKITHLPNPDNIPQSLRVLADDIENGVINGNPDYCIVIVSRNDLVSWNYFGNDAKFSQLLGIVDMAKHQMIEEIFHR